MPRTLEEIVADLPDNPDWVAPVKPKKPRGMNRGTTTYDKPRWRFGDLLRALGTEQEISDKLVMRGYPRVPPNSIFGWMRRDTVPTVWLPVILQIGIEDQFIEKIEDLRVL